VQFEDLILFAINYNQVSKDQTPPAPAARNDITLAMRDTADGVEVDLQMTADGRVQGLSVPLRWDDAVVEPVSYRPGNLLSAQGGKSLVLSPHPGTIDAALFGIRSLGIAGEGRLATITFRRKSQGDPAIGLGSIDARNAENQPEVVNGVLGQDPVVPSYTRSTLERPIPNPFNPRTVIQFAVAQAGPVQVRIYGLDGRLVRTLVDGFRDVGVYDEQWNGTDDAGRTVASGAYIVRMVAADRAQSRTVTLLK
jgi:hypothetical protein